MGSWFICTYQMIKIIFSHKFSIEVVQYLISCLINLIPFTVTIPSHIHSIVSNSDNVPVVFSYLLCNYVPYRYKRGPSRSFRFPPRFPFSFLFISLASSLPFVVVKTEVIVRLLSGLRNLLKEPLHFLLLFVFSIWFDFHVCRNIFGHSSII